ncbi:MAG: hypothetical protein U5L04_00420 [Trueperaceae bacterium]|nr:hypothetical protein [Trueperaceae bacterium]
MDVRRLIRHLLVMVGAALLVWGSAQEASFTANAVRGGGLPGSYVTLSFEVRGQGTVGYQVRPPSGWSVLTATGTLELDGDGFVAVTLRVPSSRYEVVGVRSARRRRHRVYADGGGGEVLHRA